ncbi:MAG: RNA polymerase factor sigma-54 [Bacteroidaceae bacterium]|nr:RNA polymerase factor sigma-54 [Bacteroidaceae bacterium]
MARQGNVEIQTQVQTQTLALSPQQVLEVRLLQLSGAEFEERVRAELDDNPALEEKFDGDPETDSEIEQSDNQSDIDGYDDYSADAPQIGDPNADFASADDIPDYYSQPRSMTPDQQAAEIPFSDTTSFYDQLNEQLAEQDLTELQEEIARYIIGSLDENGFLEKSIQEITDDLAIYQFLDVTEKEVEEVLHVIWQFDPPGIGARNLQECLLIQIAREEKPANRELETLIIRDWFDDFTHKRWDRITQKLGLTEEKFKPALDNLLHLNPRPGSALGEAAGRSTQQVNPDFTVESYDGQIHMSLNNFNVPELKVSQSFSQMLESQIASGKGQQKAEALYVKQKIDSARGFIDAMQQRYRTLSSTMKAIIDLQKPFFLEGDESLLKPMILKDVADRTGLDISTISRATSEKYVQTDFGIFPLKFFFTDGFTTSSGEEVSVKEIHRILRELTDAEDKAHPLTDDQLASALNEKGYPVARRTVAKYREQLGIPVARMRR